MATSNAPARGYAVTSTSNETLDFGTWHGGEGTFVATDTFDSAEVNFQFRIKNAGSSVATAWRDVSADTTLTAAGDSNFSLPAGVELQVVISGGSESSQSITVGLA